MQRFFSKVNNEKYMIAQEIRQMVVFASHDLTRDPPFTRINIVCCRNLLIYFEPEVQQRVMALFHFALKEQGTLFLGPSETVGGLVNEFEVLDQHWRFYQKIRDVRLPEISNVSMTSPMLNVVTRQSSSTSQKADDDGWLRQTAYEDLLSKYVPPSLLVNEFDEVVHSFGDARKLLKQPEGRPTLNVIKMLDGDLKSALSAALHRAKRENENVSFTGIESDDGKVYDLTVEPWSRGSKSLLLVCFVESNHEVRPIVENENTISFQPNQGSVDRIVELERELDYSRQSLQATVEELETSNEELQSTNEELIASNEELQSTNEELHSVNEELYTVNAEHQRKIGELTLVNNDLSNFMSSSDIGTIFLDLELRIRRFTPSISSAFHVIEQDIGRPIDHIAFNLDSPNLIGNIKEVLEREISSEAEVRSRDGKTYLQRIQPYRTGTGEIQGVVLTFDDITAVISTVRKLEKMEEELSITQKELQVFAYAVSHDLGTPLRHISSHCVMLEEELGEALSKEALHDIKVVQDGAERLREMIDGLLAFSRIYTRGATFDEVHFDSVVTEAIEKSQELISSSGANVTFDEMPTVRGDSQQLLQLMVSLIQNSIHYSSDDPPVIHIDAKREGNYWQISIHDNGIGINKRHLERVFIIFQRLKFKEGVEGLGLGLSIAKRIVERHNGWMWIESGEGKGSTVFFKLPIGE